MQYFHAVLLVVAGMAAGTASAQAPAPLSLPNQPLQSTGHLRAGASLPDGRRYVSGDFRWINGERATGYWQRLLLDGRRDRTWTPAAEVEPWYLSTADDAGNLYVVTPDSRRIVKLSGTDGSVDPAFQAAATQINALEVRAGFLYAAGNWRMPGGAPASMVRLSLATGAPDPGFAPHLADQSIQDFAFDPQGRAYVMVAGGFSRILQNGQVDPTWSGGYLQNYGRKLSATSDALYVGQKGPFGEEWNVRKLRASDGSFDTTFDVTFVGYLEALHADAAGGVWVGGHARIFNGVPIGNRGIFRLTPQGQLDELRTPDCLCSVYDIQAGRDPGSLDLYGSIAEIEGLPRFGIAQITDQGEVLSEIASIESPGLGTSLVRQQDGRILVGGTFYKVGSHVTHHVARFNVDGTLDRSFASRARTTVKALAVSPLDGAIFVGGFGQNADGRGNLAKLHPATGAAVAEWTADVPYPGPRSLAASSDGYLYVGGTFAGPNGSVRRFAQAGGGMPDSGWQLTPAPTGARAVLTDEAGSLFIAVSGRVARYEISSRTRVWERPASTVSRLFLATGYLFASGVFCVSTPSVPAEQRCGIVRLDAATGAVDAGWNFRPATETPPDYYFAATGMTVSPGGEMIAGGYYFNDTEASGFLWRLDPAGDGTPMPGWQPSVYIPYTVLADTGNRVWVVGDYTDISGVARAGVGALPLVAPDEIVFVDEFE